jgi:hypothetical protein
MTMDVSIKFMLGLSKFIVDNNQSTTFHFNLGFIDLWLFFWSKNMVAFFLLEKLLPFFF